MTTVTYAQLRATDPGRWQAAALAWRTWATLSGRWTTEFRAHASRLNAVWAGAAAIAAAARLSVLRRSLVLFRLLCWEVDQALSEFAAAVTRAKTLLARAIRTARKAGLTVDEHGRIASAATHLGTAAPAALVASGADHAAADMAAALAVAAQADSAAAERLTEATAAASASGVPPAPATPLPPCTATPAEVRRWWDSLSPEQRRWLVATEPGWLGPLDGVPTGFRDLANRLLLDDRRTELERAAGEAQGSERHRLRNLQVGLSRLTDRLTDGGGPRAYLLRLDLAEEGRAVVALGDPDRAGNVLTQVPGMTADLKSYRGELARVERVAVHAAEVDPAVATSGVMWLDYDAPDFLAEAASATRAEAGAGGLRRFEAGLRASHQGGPAHQTVMGHSYGSLVVGSAAKSTGLDADDVVFVGSPGVGVDSAAELHVPTGRVWSSTSRSDVIQYAAVSPRSLVEDARLAEAAPLIGPLLAFGTPEKHLWFGHNPSDPAFGAHVFRSQLGGGHLGYWDVGSPALGAITAITLGTAR